MDLEEVILAPVGLSQLADCQAAADLALDVGDLPGTVEPVVDPYQMHTAFEHSRRLLVAVLLLQGQQHIESKLDERKLLELLMAELPLSKAAELTSRLTGQGKNDLYKMALDIKNHLPE